ncbi:MAG: proton-conducting transporter membrane subunit [Eubacteriales bacterium]
MSFLVLLPLVLALFFGLLLSFKKFEDDLALANYGIFATVLISCSVYLAIFFAYEEKITLLPLDEPLGFTFHLDGLGLIFSALIAFLWPFATYYAKTYMSHEGKYRQFFSFYILSYGAVLGLAFSENMFTLYFFYELITFITLPLVAHSGDARAKYAGKVYITYMIFGASLSFAGMMIFLNNVGEFHFVYGGISQSLLNTEMQIAYVLMFLGFGIKAGLVPFHKWIIIAGVAPTTVTALLHAVAVVKSGVFAVMRLTYFLYDYETLQGSAAQAVVLSLVIFSVVYGSYMAVRSLHLKRRLAYSTISQLSYILLGVASMSIWGLKAAVLHMIFHAFCKIVLFYFVGNVTYSNFVEHLSDIKGYGTVLKTTCLSMTISGMGLIGIPPFGNFFSKIGLAMSLFTVPGWGMVALFALMTSALLTMIYIFQMILMVYLPEKSFSRASSIDSAPRSLELVLAILTVSMIGLSVCSNWIMEALDFYLKVGV